MATPATNLVMRRFNGRFPELLRVVFLVVTWIVALGAALAPIVYLLRRMGVG